MASDLVAIFASVFTMLAKLIEGWGIPLDEVIAELKKNPTVSAEKTADALRLIKSHLPDEKLADPEE